MRKSQLILWAMLVSNAIAQSAQAADNAEIVLQGQEAQLDMSFPATAQTAPAPPALVSGAMSGATSGATQTLAPGSIPAKRPATFSGSSQITSIVPLAGRNTNDRAQWTSMRPVPQVAMVSPAYTQDNLFKALYNWSSVLTVEFVAPLSTKTAKVGDLVETKLVQDFRWGAQLIASKDSLVRGHVISVELARTLTRSALSTERTLKSRGRLAIQFDEIVDQNGRVWPIRATPSPRQKNNTNIDRSSQRYVEVDAEGRIVKAESGLAGGMKATSNAAKVATMVPLPGTLVFTTLAPAVAMGAVGAASPSIAYDKPLDASEEHARAKGAAYGFLTNLPGAFVVRSVVEKGNEISLSPGDQLTLNICITDTGYKLPPGQQLNVNGKIITQQPTKRLYPAGQQSSLRQTY